MVGHKPCSKSFESQVAQCERVLKLFLAFVLAVGLMPALQPIELAFADQPANSCGDDLTWSFDSSTGMLAIEGEGDMYDYDWTDVPWVNVKNRIRSIVVSNGVASIGIGAFYDLPALEKVTIPEGLERLGDYSFGNCTALQDINLPASLTDCSGAPFSGSGLDSATLAAGSQIVPEYLFSGCRYLTSVAIPPSVSSIGDYAFNGCTSLSSIELPNALECLGYEAFGGCTALSSVVIPAALSESSGCCFAGSGLRSAVFADGTVEVLTGLLQNCALLTTVTLPATLESIGSYAFSDCGSLYSLDIPASVESIGESAFSGCTQLSSIGLPEGIKSLGSGAFSGTSITSITIPASLCVADGQASWALSGSSLESAVISEGAEYIPNFLFSGCTELTSVSIPSSVTTLGSYAFEGCSSLASVIIPTGVTVIEEGAFNGCSALSEVLLPEGLTTLGDASFRGTAITSVTVPVSLCDSETQGRYASPFGDNLASAVLAQGASRVPSYLFSDCSRLTAVELPGTLETIGESAFSGCSSLPSIDLPISTTRIENSAFYGCSSLERLAVPSSVVSIESSAFAECSSLATLELNEGIRELGSSAFYGTAFTSVDIPASLCAEGGSSSAPFGPSLVLATIAEGAVCVPSALFSGCAGLTNVSIPSGVTAIEQYAFSGCESLASMKIPSGVTHIGGWAFNGCSSLSSFTMPPSVDNVGEYAFGSCTALLDILFPSDAPGFGYYPFDGCAIIINYPSNADGWSALIDETAENNWLGGTLTWRPYTPDDATLNASASVVYSQDNNLCFFSLDAVEGLGEDADAPAYQWQYSTDGGNAWDDVDGARGTKLTMASSSERELNWTVRCVVVAADGRRTATNSLGFPKRDVDETVLSDGTFGNTISWQMHRDGALSLLGVGAMPDTEDIPWSEYSDSITSLSIGSGITSIRSSAFQGSKYLSALEIASSVTSIDSYAFFGCTSLTTVMLHEGLAQLGERAFGDCTALSSITLPESLASASWGPFSGSGLRTAVIAEGATSVPNGLFESCTLLSSVALPESLASIGDNAFSGCRTLASVSIPEGVTYIGGSAFYGCYRLTSVSLPSQLAHLGEGAFNETSITSVEIPASMCGKNTQRWGTPFGASLASATIAEGAELVPSYLFYGCTGLESVSIPSSAISIEDYAFYGCTALSAIELPNGMKSLGDGAFGGCAALNSVALPASLTWSGWAPFREGGLQSVTLAEGAKSVPDNLFAASASLESVAIPGSVTSIGSYAFDGCTALSTVEMPESVTKIGSRAFGDCTALESISIPSNVSRIDDSAFNGCSALLSVDLPEGISYLGYYAFASCSSLKSIELPASLCLPGQTPGGSYMGSGFLSGCGALETIYLPSGGKLDIASALDCYYGLQWATSSTDIVDITPAGIATAYNPGSAAISAVDESGEEAVSLVCSVSVSALSVGSVKGYRGDRVSLDVSAGDLEGAVGGSFILSYDKKVLSLVEAVPNREFADGTCSIDTSTPGVVRVSLQGLAAGQIEGALLSLSFDIRDDAALGSTNVVASRISFTSQDGGAYSGATRTGRVLVRFSEDDQPLNIYTYEYTLSRDYGQLVPVFVENISGETIRYYLEADNPYTDAYLNFVDCGSESQPITILPGETQEIDMSVFLQNAKLEEYDIPVTSYVESGGSFHSTGTASIRFNCYQPHYDVFMNEASVDEVTLVKTLSIANQGDDISDFALRVEGADKDYVSLSEGYENYYFPSWSSFNVTLVPDLAMMKADGKTTVDCTIVASSSEWSESLDVAFDTDGKEITAADAYQVALAQEGNPYYDIAETTFDSNVQAVNESNWELFVGDDGSFEMDSSSTYSYGANSTATVDVTVRLVRSDNHGSGEACAHYVQNDASTGMVTGTVRIDLSSDQSYELIAGILGSFGDALDVKGQAEELAKRYAGIDDGSLEIITRISDPLLSKMVELAAGDYYPTIKSLFDAIDTAKSAANAGAKIADLMKLWSNPTLSDTQKQAYTLLEIAEIATSRVADPTGGVLSMTYETGFKLIRTFYDTVNGAGPLSKLNNWDLGNYIHQMVKGSQCTNAGQTGVKMTLALGLKAIFAWGEVYSRMGRDPDFSSNILEYLGDGGSARSGQSLRSQAFDASSPQLFLAASDPSPAAFVWMTGRMGSGESTFVDKTNNQFGVLVNGVSVGSIRTASLTDVFSFGILSDAFSEGENEIVRTFNTNAGHYFVTADTELNILVPKQTDLSYLGDAVNYRDIRSLPDFAVYPENIVIDTDGAIAAASVGKECTVKASIYNRGPHGGWVDAVFTSDGQEVYRSENLYVGGFSGQTVSFAWTPSTTDSTVEVALVNKTDGYAERTVDNNHAVSVIEAVDYVVPGGIEIRTSTLDFSGGTATEKVIVDVQGADNIENACFYIDGSVVGDGIERVDYRDYSRFSTNVDAENLEEGEHTLRFEATFDVGGGGWDTVSKESTIYVVTDSEDEPEPPRDKAAYVRMLYKEILGNSAPTDFQVGTWVGNIEGGQRIVDVVTQFTQSAAFADAGYTSEQKVRVLYAGMLGVSDPTDFQVSYWAAKLDGGTPVEQVVDGFGQSAAFGTVCVSYGFGADGKDVTPKGGVEDYVRMLYREILGNDNPSDFQVGTWTTNISNGQRAVDVAVQFTQSAAFAGKGYTSADKVRRLYAGILGNGSPTDFQVSYWAGKLDSGTPLEEVIDGFGQSAAFGVVRGLYGLTK